LIAEILERREQAVVFSAFHDPLDHLSRWIADAGVRHVTLDGRVSQKRRGEKSALFKQGRCHPHSIPVMLAGVECMAEGHSYHLANNVILLAYSWAYDKFKQALDRVHRMNSLKAVNVYVVLCQGSIDRKLESLVQEKSDAAELVLDGRLIGERTEEVNLAELLQVARREFNEKDHTLDEALLQAEWPKLRAKLATAMQGWETGFIEAPVEVEPVTSAVIVNAPVRFTPSEAPVTLSTVLPDDLLTQSTKIIPFTLPAPNWKSRLRARATRLNQFQRTDV
jgi:hypothetical protein